MNRFKQLLFLILIIFIYSIVYYLSYNLVEPKAYDFMVKNCQTQKFIFDNKKQVYGSDDIVLVVVDAKSVDRYRWPWKREFYCNIFEYLKLANPKLIIHDALITTLDKEDLNSDLKYFSTIKKINNLIVGFLPRINNWDDNKKGQLIDISFKNKFGLDVIDKSYKKNNLYNSIYPFPKEYFNSVKNIGSVLMIPGFINGNIKNWAVDEIFRTHEYLIHYKDTYYPSLALSSYLMLNNNPQIELTKNRIRFKDKNFEIKYKQTQYQKIVPIKYYKLYNTGYSHKMYSAVDVIDSYNAIKNNTSPIIDISEFKDKIIVVGVNVPAGAGLNDNKNSPISVSHPGVDIQATVVNNIINNDFLIILPMFVNIIITLLGMFLVYGFIRFSNLFKSILSTLVIIFSYLLIAGICYYYGIVINVITPVVMFVLITIFAYTDKFILENKNKEKVKFAMGKYMSQDVMKRVIQDIDNLGLGGKRSVVTVLFSDIRGFTTMSEKMSPQEVSEILNEYFTEMEPIITKYNGIINKFIGDAVMAVFGEPIQDKNHAQNAVKCAYEMLQKVKELQQKWVKENKPKIEIGIGISTGEVFVGNIGSINRMEYTVIGDTVNLASRLEGYNKIYKTKLLISPFTYEEVKGFVDVIKISDVQIRGKANKMDIYEILKVKY